jgi:hypothetical protein
MSGQMYKPEMCIYVSKVYKSITFFSTEEGCNEKVWRKGMEDIFERTKGKQKF